MHTQHAHTNMPSHTKSNLKLFKINLKEEKKVSSAKPPSSQYLPRSRVWVCGSRGSVYHTLAWHESLKPWSPWHVHLMATLRTAMKMDQAATPARLDWLSLDFSSNALFLQSFRNSREKMFRSLAVCWV